MRRLIADLYKIIFHITGSKFISLFVAIGYISLLNLLTIYGLILLTEEWLPELLYAHRAFVFPYIIDTGLAIAGFNFYIMLPLQNLTEEINLKPVKKPIIIYTVVSALLFAYILLIAR